MHARQMGASSLMTSAALSTSEVELPMLYGRAELFVLAPGACLQDVESEAPSAGQTAVRDDASAANRAFTDAQVG
jgi:hypothetical protein